MPVLTHSDWHRWDPHIHAPGTALEDRFAQKWNDFLERIATAEPPVTALGITDYLSTRCYEEFLRRRPAGHAPELVFVFPNIEFRLAPRTAKGHAINAHLLVSPDDPSHIAQVRDSLSRLTVTIKGEVIPCSESGLIKLGRLHLGPGADDASAYIAGVEQFKVDVSAFLRWLNNEMWLRRNSLLAIAGGNDGLAGLRRDSGFRQYHDELVAAADVVFSAQPTDIAYYTGRGAEPREAIEARYGSLKPCLHGSDAHELDRVLRPDHDRYCWIKAAPTFDGLRQILFEPAERVHIGPVQPPGPDPDQVIEKIVLKDHDGWFVTEEIPLSQGLSAIIGEKGSGKTALADMIALAADAWDPTDSSFLTKAQDHLLGAKIELVWRSGRTSQAMIPAEPTRDVRAEIRYLSQQFVERLCSGDLLAEELVREVERVVYEHIPPKERMNSVDFDDLRRKKTAALQAERDELRNVLSGLNDTINRANEQKRRLPKMRVELQQLQAAAARLEANLRSMVSVGDSGVADNIRRLRQKRDMLTARAAKVQEQITKTEDVRSKILRTESRFAQWYDDLRSELLAAGVPQSEWPKFKPTFTGTPLDSLDTHRARLQAQYSALVGGPGDSDKQETISRLTELIQAEERKLELDERRRRKIAQSQRELDGVAARIQSLQEEIASIERWEAEERPKIRERRDAAYARYFELLEEEKAALMALYEPLRRELAERSTGEKDLDFEVVTTVDVARWAAVGEDMLDLRRSGPYTTRGALEAEARQLLEPAWKNGDADALRERLRRIGERLLEGAGLAEKLRQGYTLKHVADWLYSVDHIRLEYGLRYRGTPLRLLSPGTRGIVLLILYLAVDTLDDRPLVVDQPEENLDNASVFGVLGQYFREAKRRRQIIVVTHNPNLVVNTDAEQVIIATARRRESGLPEIGYSFGPLEHVRDLHPASPIKDQVCEILEGGKSAFQSRQRRYS